MVGRCVEENWLHAYLHYMTENVRFAVFNFLSFSQRFTWQLNLGNFTTCGTGHSKKIAK